MHFEQITALTLAPVIASLVIALGTATVFSACGLKDDGTWMRCHSVQDTIVLVAAIITVVLAAAIFIKSGKIRAVFYVLGGIGSAIMFALPGMIMPMCMMQTMRCYEVMQPFVRILSIILLVLCVIALIHSWRAATNDIPQSKR